MPTKSKEMTAQRAAEIVNDIHEGMCKASRKELIECVNFYAMRSTYLWQEVDTAYTKVSMQLLDAAGESFNQLKQFKERWEKKDSG